MPPSAPVPARQHLLGGGRRIVVKIGSNLIAPEGVAVRTERLRALAGQVAELRKAGREAILVSSGAIASGMRVLGLDRRPSAVEQKQALAAIGQPELMRAYAEEFGRHNLRVAQVLVTREDLRSRGRFLNARRAIEAVLGRGVVPVVNENDVVAVDEIRMGDNDTLSALVTILCGADLLVMLTDVDGLYRGDPRKAPDARPVDEVAAVTAEVRRWAGHQAGSEVGTGGMLTKLRAAMMVTRTGRAALIANGSDPRILARVLAGGPGGTLFLPAPRRMDARKRWLAFGVRPAGTVVVDAGAREALERRGVSLLPKGVVRVTGGFGRGDAVAIQDDRGRVFAHGITSYSAEELGRIRGLATRDIAKVLGYAHGDEVVQRDRLVLLEGES